MTACNRLEHQAAGREAARGADSRACDSNDGWDREEFMNSDRIRLITPALLVFAVFLSASAVAQEETYVIWGNAREGRKVYAEKGCGKCHAINGVGPNIGPDLARSEGPQTITQVAAAMWNHAPEMHRLAQQQGLRWQPFQGSEMRDLISFLFFLRVQDKPGNIRRGARLFDDKRCSSCHALVCRGSKIGPDLSQLHYGSPVLLAEIMWRHALDMEGKMREMGLSWPRFTDNEMADLIAFIRSQETDPKTKPASQGQQ